MGVMCNIHSIEVLAHKNQIKCLVLSLGLSQANELNNIMTSYYVMLDIILDPGASPIQLNSDLLRFCNRTDYKITCLVQSNFEGN